MNIDNTNTAVENEALGFLSYNIQASQIPTYYFIDTLLLNKSLDHI